MFYNLICNFAVRLSRNVQSMKYYSIIIFLIFHICAFSQNLTQSNQYMEVGGKYIINFDKKGAKSLIAECLESTYSDSTEYGCKKNYTIRFSAEGKDIPLGSRGSYRRGLAAQGIDQSFSSYGTYNYDINLPNSNLTLKKGQSITLKVQIPLHSGREFVNELKYDDYHICLLESQYDNSLFVQKRKDEQRRIYEEYKRKQEEYINSLTPPVRDNLEFDLLPKNIINYLGKITREEFEKLVGSALDDEEGFIIYEIKNKYDEVVTALRCYYRESDGKLISIRFPTPHYLAYWIDFVKLDGYPKTEAIAKKNGNYLPKRDKFNRLYQLNLKLKSFGCQIMNIKEYSNYSTAVVNYHIVK